jgi:hypothetical protein
LEEIMRMHEKAPEFAELPRMPRQRTHRHRATSVDDGASAPLRPRPGRRRVVRDLGGAS